MDKLKFEFMVRAGEDPKTNIMCITSITDTDMSTFLVPEKHQPARLHEAVLATQAYQNVKNTIQKRHEKRQVWISLTPEMSKVYRDQDGNMQFQGYLLEEIPQKPPSAGISDEILTKILKSVTETKKDTPKPHSNVKKLAEKFVIEKFNTKTSNVSQWMTIFETECARLEIVENVQKIECFRLFLMDSCLDWYGSMLIKHTVDSEWSVWKNKFCETFADKGWSPVRYAILFKYRQGSLLEYALKKERLILEVNKSIDKITLIDLIATGLPNFVADKIDRNDLKETEDLFNAIRGLEYLVNKKNIEKKKEIGSSETNFRERNKYIPCKICEKENKGNRYHPESSCWFKNKNSDRPKTEQIRSVNNSELETELNDINPKN